MAARVTISLSEPFEAHGKTIREVVLRAPVYRDLMELGDPTVLAKTGDSVCMVEDHAALRTYIERCIVDPDPLLLEHVSLVDAYKIKDTMIGFFTAARLGQLSTKSDSSSSP